MNDTTLDSDCCYKFCKNPQREGCYFVNNETKSFEFMKPNQKMHIECYIYEAIDRSKSKEEGKHE